MHELPLTNKILEIAIDHANKNNGSKITEIILSIGELSDIEEHWMNHYFGWIAKDSIASEATLKINKVKVEWRCDACGNTFMQKNIESENPKCFKCREEKKLSLIKGREFLVEAITII